MKKGDEWKTAFRMRYGLFCNGVVGFVPSGRFRIAPGTGRQVPTWREFGSGRGSGSVGVQVSTGGDHAA